MKRIVRVFVPERFRRSGAFFDSAGSAETEAGSWKSRPVVRRSGVFFNVARAAEQFAEARPKEAVGFLKDQWESYRQPGAPRDQDVLDVEALVTTLLEQVSIQEVDGQAANAFRGLALLKDMVQTRQEDTVFAGRSGVILDGLTRLERDLATRG